MQTKRCEELAARAREYERSPKRQYHAEGGGDTEVWYEKIHQHFEEVLLGVGHRFVQTVILSFQCPAAA